MDVVAEGRQELLEFLELGSGFVVLEGHAEFTQFVIFVRGVGAAEVAVDVPAGAGVATEGSGEKVVNRHGHTLTRLGILGVVDLDGWDEKHSSQTKMFDAHGSPPGGKIRSWSQQSSATG